MRFTTRTTVQVPPSALHTVLTLSKRSTNWYPPDPLAEPGDRLQPEPTGVDLPARGGQECEVRCGCELPSVLTSGCLEVGNLTSSHVRKTGPEIRSEDFFSIVPVERPRLREGDTCFLDSTLALSFHAGRCTAASVGGNRAALAALHS